MLKSQQRFKTKKHNVFTEEINKIASSDKRIQSIDSIEMRMEQAKIQYAERRKLNVAI